MGGMDAGKSARKRRHERRAFAGRHFLGSAAVELRSTSKMSRMAQKKDNHEHA
jgi:hypothetical protein